MTQNQFSIFRKQQPATIEHRPGDRPNNALYEDYSICWGLEKKKTGVEDVWSTYELKVNSPFLIYEHDAAEHKARITKLVDLMNKVQAAEKLAEVNSFTRSEDCQAEKPPDRLERAGRSRWERSAVSQRARGRKTRYRCWNRGRGPEE